MRTSLFAGFLTAILALSLIACGDDAIEFPSDAVRTDSAAVDSVLNRYQQAVEAQVESDPTSSYAGATEELHQALQRFYERSGYALAWSDEREPLPRAETLFETVRNAEEEGLAHASYETERIERLMEEAETQDASHPKELAQLDVLLTFTFMRHASDLYAGRVRPQDVNPDWYTERDSLDLAALQRKALADERALEETFQQLTPEHEGYHRLKEAMTRYREIAQEDGWPEISEGDILTVGDTSARVLPLRERLAATDDLADATAEADSVFDEELAAALARFQERHNLEPDSVLGSEALQALNVPAQERARTLQVNLERWHWLPSEFSDRYIIVNIPEFRLRAFDGDSLAEEMAVVVGEEYDDSATPIFSDEMDHLIFNPYWNVPHSIAEEEILPKARENEDFLEASNYQIVDTYDPEAEVYPPTSENLDAVEEEELFIQQTPGPLNALGQVKFMFPNEHAIYLHDTPADALFEYKKRTFSHGCVRVERPEDLAAFVLKNTEGWDAERIEEAMESDDWQRVELSEEIPVYLAYWTAYVDEEGNVQFREDFYGHDKELSEALQNAS